jgi:hypothetical protein
VLRYFTNTVSLAYVALLIQTVRSYQPPTPAYLSNHTRHTIVCSCRGYSTSKMHANIRRNLAAQGTTAAPYSNGSVGMTYAEMGDTGGDCAGSNGGIGGGGAYGGDGGATSGGGGGGASNTGAC